jgi:ubiquitin carboxyl-terminal hydrolase 7
LDAPPAVPQKYHLHGVLVHSGDLNAGHYFSFIRPKIENRWFKFDDDCVTPASESEVLESNFGGEIGGEGKRIRRSNAYMLIYIRESDLEEILAPITEKDIPNHLKLRFDEELERTKQRRKDASEQHLYLKAEIFTDNDARNHKGFDVALNGESIKLERNANMLQVKVLIFVRLESYCSASKNARIRC